MTTHQQSSHRVDSCHQSVSQTVSKDVRHDTTAKGYKSLLRSTLRAGCRNYPLLRGRDRLIAGRLCRKAVEGFVPVVETRLNTGETLLVRPGDILGRTVYFFGDLDPQITWVCKQLLRPGDAVLDIGANIGLVTTIAASRVGPTGCVYAFEPQPRLARMIEQSAALNGWHHVTVHALALGDHHGTMALSVPPDDGGRGTLVTQRQGDDSLEVPVRRLDACLGDRLDLRIRLLKIDVEGFEVQALLGAQELLDQQPPEAILFEELGPLLWGQSFWDCEMVKLLSQRDYRFIALPRTWLRMTPQRVVMGADVPTSGKDYLALHASAELPRGLMNA